MANVLDVVPDQLQIDLDDNGQQMQLLGQGSFASVYLARWHGAGVAVKVLHTANKAASKNDIKKFMKELAQLCQCSHPNLIQFIGVTTKQFGEVPGIVMELMACTLHERFTAHPCLSISEEISIMQGVASGLSYLHSMRILHRDVSCSNVMLASTQSCHAKITDVGGSRQLSEGAMVAGMTRSPGNPSYMAPETFQDERDNRHQLAVYGYAADVYSVGVVLLATIVRHEPQNVWVIAREGRYSDINSVSADHPLKPLLVACLADQPTARPRAKHLALQLAALKKRYPLENSTTSMSPVPWSELTTSSMDGTEQRLRSEVDRLMGEVHHLREQKELKQAALEVMQSQQAEEQRSLTEQLEKEQEASKVAKQEASDWHRNYQTILKAMQERDRGSSRGEDSNNEVECRAQYRSVDLHQASKTDYSRVMSQSYTQGICNPTCTAVHHRSDQGQIVIDLIGQVQCLNEQVISLKASKGNAEHQVRQLQADCESLKSESSRNSIDSDEIVQNAELEVEKARMVAGQRVQEASLVIIEVRRELDIARKQIADVNKKCAEAKKHTEEAKDTAAFARASHDEVVRLQDKLVDTLLSPVYSTVSDREKRAMAATYFLLGAGRGRQVIQEISSMSSWKIYGQLPIQATNRCNQVCLFDGYIYIAVAIDDSDELHLLRAPLKHLKSWESVSLPLGQKWNYHCYLLSFNGLLHLIASNLDRSQPYDIFQMGANDTWQHMTRFPLVRRAFGICVRGSKLAIVGGCCGVQYGRDDPVLTPEIYDTANGQWQRLPCLPQYCKSPTVLNIDGALHVLGGHGYVEDNHHTVFSISMMPPFERQSWSASVMPAVPFRRCGATLVNNQVVVAGGQSHDRVTTTDSVMLLDRNSRDWIELPRLCQEQFSPRLITDGKCVVCLGGFDSRGRFLRDIEILEI